jgi:hypothetical protein
MVKVSSIFPLIFILVSCGNRTTTDRISDTQWKLFNYLPYNTEYLLYANLYAINKTGFAIEHFIPQFENDSSKGWINKFEHETGINLNDGISEIVISNTTTDQSVILISFNKNYELIKKYFKENIDFEKNIYNEEEIYTLKGKSNTGVYLPGTNLVIVANKASYLDSLITGNFKGISSNENFISIIKNITNKENVWMATDKGAFAAGLFDRLAGKDSKLLSPEILSSIDNMTVSAEFNDGADIETVLGCSTTGNAYLLSVAVEGAIAMNILSEKNPKLGKIFNKMDVNREGNLIRFKINLSNSNLNDIKLLTKGKTQAQKF